MITISLAQCNKSLNFRPLKPWPKTLPAFATRLQGETFLLAGFDHDSNSPDAYAVILEGPVENLLADIYQSLTWPELARLCQTLRNKIDVLPVLQKFQVPAGIESESLFEALLETPTLFQDWVSQKQPGLRELQILKMKDHLPEPRSWFQILEKIAALNSSKSIGLQIAEWSAELLAAKTDLTKLFQNTERAEEWHRAIQKLRFPLTSTSDQEREIKVKRLPWPIHTHAKWVRQGDRAGIEVRFHVSSVHELEQKIKGLNLVKDGLQKDVWTLKS